MGRKTLFLIFVAALGMLTLVSPSFAGNAVVLTDEELDCVYAEGLFFDFEISFGTLSDLTNTNLSNNTRLPEKNIVHSDNQNIKFIKPAKPTGNLNNNNNQNAEQNTQGQPLSVLDNVNDLLPSNGSIANSVNDIINLSDNSLDNNSQNQGQQSPALNNVNDLLPTNNNPINNINDILSPNSNDVNPALASNVISLNNEANVTTTSTANNNSVTTPINTEPVVSNIDSQQSTSTTPSGLGQEPDVESQLVSINNNQSNNQGLPQQLISNPNNSSPLQLDVVASNNQNGQFQVDFSASPVLPQDVQDIPDVPDIQTPTSAQLENSGFNILPVTNTGLNVVIVDDFAQQYLSSLVNVNAAGSIVPVLINITININSTIENLSNVNSLGLNNYYRFYIR